MSDASKVQLQSMVNINIKSRYLMLPVLWTRWGKGYQVGQSKLTPQWDDSDLTSTWRYALSPCNPP